jgi:hypothetical protein
LNANEIKLILHHHSSHIGSHPFLVHSSYIPGYTSNHREQFYFGILSIWRQEFPAPLSLYIGVVLLLLLTRVSLDEFSISFFSSFFPF